MGTANILDELDWRGLIAQSTDRAALGDQLAAGPVTVYSGFDPTAPSLHAGHLIPLLTLRRQQFRTVVDFFGNGGVLRFASSGHGQIAQAFRVVESTVCHRLFELRQGRVNDGFDDRGRTSRLQHVLPAE